MTMASLHLNTWFSARDSTGIALTCFSDTVLDNMDKNLVTGAVYLDLTEAFDTVDHQRLIHKLHLIGFVSHTVE